LDHKEFWETFRSCLDKLPQRVADVFMLREMEELETAQICEALKISQNNTLGDATPGALGSSGVSGVELV
jgi:DNA-directed RNA polymerase specialized sigma24 family protein